MDVATHPGHATIPSVDDEEDLDLDCYGLVKEPKEEWITRRCNKCDKKFRAKGKFNIICRSCQNTGEWKYGRIHETPGSNSS